MPFKEIYCSDCKEILARYSTEFFTDHNINELMRFHFSAHIKDGHLLELRLVSDD
jgi:hypothetical protein